MISLELKHDILKAYFFDNKPIKQIAEEYRISKNTVKKYIRKFQELKNNLSTTKSMSEKELLIQFIAEKPSYDTSNRKPTVATEEIIEKITQYLKQNEEYIQRGMKKQCMKAVDMYEALLEDGHLLSYRTVNRYVRQLQPKHSKEAFIKQVYDYGDICEFDCGEVKLEINHVLKTFKIAVFTSAAGNYRFAYLYPKEAMEFFLDAHVRFFNHIGKVYHTLVYDNMKVAVARFVGRTEKEATEALKNSSLYYGFRYRFCNVRRGNEKGHVERSVEYIRRKAFSRTVSFSDIEHAGEHLQEILKQLNNQKRDPSQKSPAECLKEELAYMLPLMPSYDTAKITQARVNKYSAILLEGNYYSVPDILVDKMVTAKLYTDCVRIFFQGELTAEHQRAFGSHQWKIKIEHYKRTLLKKPGAWKGRLALQAADQTWKELFDSYFQDTPKDFILLLDLIAQHSLEKTLEAIEKLKKKQIGIVYNNIRILLEQTSLEENYVVPYTETGMEILETSRKNSCIYSQMFHMESFSEGEKLCQKTIMQ